MPGSTPSATSSSDLRRLWTTCLVVHSLAPFGFLGAVAAVTVHDMTHSHEVCWSISGIDQRTDYRSGATANLSQAWLAALSAGRAALLAGRLPNLAVYINGELEAMLSPGRNHTGQLDPAEITAALVEIHQGATAGELIDQLTADHPPTK